MKKLKVVTIVGTRPEIIRLSALIPKLDEFTFHTLVHTGQNYDEMLNQVFFDDLSLRKPDRHLGVDPGSMGTVMGQTLIKVEQLLLELMPDAVMILGDTNSAIAAVVSERMQIPVYHMEAGNRSFDKNVPEELNRRMVDHISTFNLPYNEHSLRNLIAEGLHPRFLCKTGSPISEIFLQQRSAILESDVLVRLGLLEKEYLLVSVHRQENVDSLARLKKIVSSLEAVAARYEKRVLISTHPRTQKRLNEAGLQNTSGLEFHAPFGYLDYARLQMGAFCVISDSGTISEESSIMGFPAVTIRDSMERPEALEVGSIIMTGLESENLIASIDLTIAQFSPELRKPDGYEVDNFSEVVLKFLFSTVGLHRKWLNLN